MTAAGLYAESSHLPRYLRTPRGAHGLAKRAAGAGNKDHVSFLYPVVKDFFEGMRLHGKHIDNTDLEDHLLLTMQRYQDAADKVDEAAWTPEAASRIKVVRHELIRLMGLDYQEVCPCQSPDAAHEAR